MQGTADLPRDPAEALEVCTRAFLGPEESLPKNVDELRGRYFNVLNDKRVLIVLDNVATSKQIRPLQPPPGCALLVTSINIISLPGLRCRVLINEFTRAEACELLIKMRGMDLDIADRIAALGRRRRPVDDEREARGRRGAVRRGHACDPGVTASAASGGVVAA